MKRQTVTISAPRQVELHQESLPALEAEQVLVETICSAISGGTELLIYRGEFPKNLIEVHDTLSRDIRYPWSCGYACVGRVIQLGPGVTPDLAGRLVFCFQPHTTHFVAAVDSLFPVPEGYTAESACFLPNMETAVNLVQDAAPILGERVLVLGQGMIGLLVASLLREFPLETLVCADHYRLRRDASPAHTVLDSSEPSFLDQARSVVPDGADLTLELSGSPAALDAAVALTRFSGRIVIGSWYGEKRASIDLGGIFHRSRLKLISSQVSTIAPELSARWDKPRRFAVAWEAIERVRPGKWITHRFPIAQAAEAYRLLDESPERAIQVILEYNDLTPGT